MPSWTVLLFALACNTPTEAAPPPPPAPAPAPVEAPAPPPPPVPPTPQQLYDACKDRVENPQAEGECTSDTDCLAAGAGGEVCTTAKAAGDLMTTAELRPCFRVLDTCACREGLCTWSLKAEVPPMDPTKEPGKLPPSLPPTGGAPPAEPPAEGGSGGEGGGRKRKDG